MSTEVRGLLEEVLSGLLGMAALLRELARLEPAGTWGTQLAACQLRISELQRELSK